MRLVGSQDRWSIPTVIEGIDDRYNAQGVVGSLLDLGVKLLGSQVRKGHLTILIRSQPSLSGVQTDENGIPLLVTPMALALPGSSCIWYVFKAEYL